MKERSILNVTYVKLHFPSKEVWRGMLQPFMWERNTLNAILCDETYMSMRNLKSHISSIHESIEFYCPLCKEEFTQKYGLDHHVRRFHCGVKSFSCKICDKSFSEQSRINRHIRTVHEGKTLYQCSICNTKLTENCSLKRHISVVHERKKTFASILHNRTTSFRK